MALSTTIFLLPAPLAPKSRNFALQIVVLFCSKHTVPVIVDAHYAKTFHTTWVRGVAYQKQLLGQILMGVWVRGAHKSLGLPLFISATIVASNFKFGTHLIGSG